MESGVSSNLITLQIDKDITSLFKFFLGEIESLHRNKRISQFEYDELRKKILDHGNEHKRQLIGFMDFFKFELDSQKVAEAAQAKRVVKRMVISNPIQLE